MTPPRLVLALALAAAGCGLKTAPVAPELVEPLPPTNLHAAPVPTGVRLVWRRPIRYSGGGRMRDIDRFDVERLGPDARGWQRIGTLSMEDRYQLRQPRTIEWTDTTAVPGTRYQYRVITVTRDGRRSLPSEPASVVHRAVPPAPVGDGDSS